MSADNGIYILSTVKKSKMEGNFHVKTTPYTVYRVAYTQAIDNFEWYKQYELYNLGAYMLQTWGQSEVYNTYEEALAAASTLAKQYSYLEYGISDIETDLTFFGDW
jgi:hypothetical protein